MQPTHRSCAIICQTVHSLTDQQAECANLSEFDGYVSLLVHITHPHGVSQPQQPSNRTSTEHYRHTQSHITIIYSHACVYLSHKQSQSPTTNHQPPTKRNYAQSPCLRAVTLIFEPKIQRNYAHISRLRAVTLVARQPTTINRHCSTSNTSHHPRD